MHINNVFCNNNTDKYGTLQKSEKETICCTLQIVLPIEIIAKMKRRWIICAYTQDKTCRTYFIKGYSKYHWYAEYVPPCKVLECLIQTNL